MSEVGLQAVNATGPIAHQQTHIAVLTQQLQRAKQVAARARRPQAATEAHRYADALLLQIETAKPT